jgi:glutamate formiminotransferase/formiminotetrahydrofolate cyclodeaminase
MALIACVPSISEGRDKKIIKAFVNAVESVAGVKVLSVDPGHAINRTGITFVGAPASALEAAFQCVKKSAELIDMSKYKGGLLHMGCVDACPFTPVEKADIQDCGKTAIALGARTGGELGIPVYLYGYAAAGPDRQNLAFLRKGQYEHLAIKLQDVPPDFGPASFNAIVKRSGAVCVGARNHLITFNINLNTKDEKTAKDIAATVRESGRNNKGGLLKAVKAFGWHNGDIGRCQISMNLEDYKKTPLYLVYETCVAEAKKRGVSVTGGEIIGLVPKDLILDTAKFYLNRQGRITLGMSMRDITGVVVKNLGLDDVTPFNMNERVLELKLKTLHDY